MREEECRLSLVRATTEKGNQDSRIFEDYLYKKEVYAKIVIGLMKNFDTHVDNEENMISKGKWFPVSDSKDLSGLMTICPGLSTLLSIDLDMVSSADSDMTSGSEDIVSGCCSVKYREEILKMIEYIIRYVSSGKGKRGYIYDASPYVFQKGKNKINEDPRVHTSDFGDNNSYLGTVCWVMTSLLKVYSASTKYIDGEPILKLKRLSDSELWGKVDFSDNKKENSHDEQLKIVKAVIKDCLKKIVEYTIVEGGDPKKKAIGWSLSGGADNRARSLYFTYRVAEVWLSLFECFENEYYLFLEMDKKDDKNKIRDKQQAQMAIEKLPDKKKKKELTEKWNHTTDERIHFMFELNNDNNMSNSQDDKSDYARLKKYLLDVSWDIWNKYGESIGNSLFYYDGSLASIDVVKRSGKSDIMFNTLFMQGIMLSSALDLDIEEKKGKNSAEYQRFYDAMEDALQNILDNYTTLMRTKNAYRVEKYIIALLSEDSEEDIVKKIRSSEIIGFSLVPLLVRVNSLLSEFVIKYPQRQMKDYLEIILSNSCLDGNEPQWAWDRDEYSTVSNYRFVNAIIDFYKYYEKYERPFLLNQNEIEQFKGELKEKNNQLKDEIASLKNQLEEKEKEIRVRDEEDSVSNIIKKLIQKSIDENNLRLIDDMYEYFSTRGQIEEKEFNNEDQLEKLSDIFLQALVQRLYKENRDIKGHMDDVMESADNKGASRKVYDKMVDILLDSVENIYINYNLKEEQ